MKHATRKQKTDPPITEGELIPGTHLRRRYQNGREINPRYVGPEILESDRLDAARADCLRCGRRVYTDGRDTYMQIAGEWYLVFVGSEPSVPWAK